MKKGITLPPNVDKDTLSLPYVQWQQEQINKLVENKELLEQEIRRLKNLPKKPKIRPSRLDKKEQDDKGVKSDKREKGGKRPGSQKRKKKKDLPIDTEQIIKAKDVPQGWELSGYKPYVVQDIIVKRNNILFQREIWRSPDGKEQMIALLPKSISGRTFGEQIRRFVIYQYNEVHATQPRIHRMLIATGVDISKGQVNRILNEDISNEVFAEDLAALVHYGIYHSDEIRTDDTGARHKGKTAYCNCINTDLFTYFETTSSKSRINFLEILTRQHKSYHINQEALSYCISQGLSGKYINLLKVQMGIILADKQAFEQFLNNNNIDAVHAIRTITEGCLIGCLIKHGFDKNTMIHSDGARQFDIFVHSLCWKHAERPLIKLHIHTAEQQIGYDKKLKAYWQIYQDLKAYKECNKKEQQKRKASIESAFDQMCQPVKNFAGLNIVLERIQSKKAELLLVLDRPITSLHNNATEREIREYTIRRKINGSTRSDNGKKYRDVFTSLKKTCRKLEVSFWDYLLDRIKGEQEIPPLIDIMKIRLSAK